MKKFNLIIHQEVRLKVLSILTALERDERITFTFMRDILKTTDGNLGIHLKKLEDNGYIKIEKTFVSRKPRTYISITKKGRNEFDKYVNTLQEIIGINTTVLSKKS
ncbi:MAG: winged helix-turn-helix domain-containing protein [Planctomycetota bacterium]|jgi:DNA-binding MarR family transcriptional regulator